MKERQVELKWALIFSVATIAWFFIEKTLGYHGENIDGYKKFTPIFIPISLLIYYLALRDIRKHKGGIISLRDSFIAGIVLSLFIAMLTLPTQWIIHNLVTPDFLTNITEYAVEKDGIDEEAAMQFFSFKSYVTQSAIQAAIKGTIISGLLSLLVRNDQ